MKGDALIVLVDEIGGDLLLCYLVENGGLCVMCVVCLWVWGRWVEG